jgi:hypothetical protein
MMKFGLTEFFFELLRCGEALSPFLSCLPPHRDILMYPLCFVFGRYFVCTTTCPAECGLRKMIRLAIVKKRTDNTQHPSIFCGPVRCIDPIFKYLIVYKIVISVKINGYTFYMFNFIGTGVKLCRKLEPDCHGAFCTL